MTELSLSPVEKSPSIHCLVIVGHIEGHTELSGGTKTTKYEHVLPALASIEQSEEVEGLLVLINTAGGDVEAGLAIAEIIAGMQTPTASLVLGGGHSIGVPIAVAAKRSFIAPSAAMTLHPVRINGSVIGAPETYRYLSQMQDRVLSFVTSHSGITGEEYRRRMNIGGGNAGETGSILDSREAVACGLIDRVGTLSDALSYLVDEAKKKD
ncbi:MAG: ATP-dependent Clp protease proteolytic subunit [Clostridia bacterium]|nr:ATP-dependent Clp protease proteolytic subunit [Clostridia bacterium]